eukprot:CAMPEP_0196667856 /NCGR_PEP_ID=MMETSP1086-20130531/65309_1 /TAXON_ID=77921 /ORGANISM="Cyanoptyche  gloeocystis , Strain SAG4.97" /LENGTH=51 /DNA_ID=CAMNT_0042005219 /DNA_START=488 /DNA_END=643 /DNA_ORIENTATION=+
MGHSLAIQDWSLVIMVAQLFLVIGDDHSSLVIGDCSLITRNYKGSLVTGYQ